MDVSSYRKYLNPWNDKKQIFIILVAIPFVEMVIVTTFLAAVMISITQKRSVNFRVKMSWITITC